MILTTVIDPGEEDVQRSLQLKTALVIVAALAFAAEAASQTADLLETRTQSAMEVLDAALVQARTEQKNVLIHFGASWCSWCLHLDAMLESDEVGGLFHENYIITHLTILESVDKTALENPGAQEMLEAAGGGDAGVPAYLIFDNRGNQLATSLAMPDGRNIGHPVTPQEIDAFLGLLERTAPRMTAAERTRVGAYLSRRKY